VHSRKSLTALAVSMHKEKEGAKAARIKASGVQTVRAVGCAKWALDKIVSVLRDKMYAKIGKAQRSLQQAYEIFGRPANGVTKSIFKAKCLELGIPLTDREVGGLWLRWDNDGNGVLDFYEFIQHVMPIDYSADQWYMKRADAIRRKQLRDESEMKIKYRPIASGTNKGPGLIPLDPDGHFPKSMEKARWNLDKIEIMIRDKIIQRCKRASREYASAYILFGRPAGGMSKAQLKEKIGLLGLQLTDGELTALMDRYDSNKSGLIDVDELFANIMPKDYPTKPWNLVRADEQYTELKRREVEPVDAAPKHLPRSMRAAEWRLDVPMIERAVEAKLMGQARKATDQKRHTYRTFFNNKLEISYPDFKEKLRMLGYVLSERQMEDMYEKYDPNAKGYIDFSDFVNNVTTSSYPDVPWYIRRAEQQRQVEHAKKHGLPVYRTKGANAIDISVYRLGPSTQG